MADESEEKAPAQNAENAETMISKEDLTSLISIVEKVLSKLKTKNNTTDNEPIPFTQADVKQIIDIIGVAQDDVTSEEPEKDGDSDAPREDPAGRPPAPDAAAAGNTAPIEGDDADAQQIAPPPDAAAAGDATQQVEGNVTGDGQKDETIIPSEAGDEAGDRPPAETDPTAAAENAGTKGGKKKKLKLKKRKKSNSRKRKNKKGTKKKY